MQQLWSAEELVEHWSLMPEELALLPGKADGGKLGFAVQLAFYKRTRTLLTTRRTLRRR